jgi:hypothetical protein
MRAIKSGGQRVERHNLNRFSLLLARISYGLIRLVVGMLGLSNHR